VWVSVIELTPCSWVRKKPQVSKLLSNFLSYWRPNVYCLIQESPPLVPILSQINPAYTIPSYISPSFLLALSPNSYIHLSAHHTCYMTCLSHPSWLYLSNYIWPRVHVMKLFMKYQLSLYVLSFISCRAYWQLLEHAAKCEKVATSWIIHWSLRLRPIETLIWMRREFRDVKSSQLNICRQRKVLFAVAMKYLGIVAWYS
jgi:hypothetical protein